MLANLAKQFELTEENTTARALRRTWWMMVVSLPAFPMIFWAIFFDLPTNLIPLMLSTLIFLITSVALIGFASSRFANRFYFPDKYLDEWEIRIKHKSIVFAVQMLMSSTVFLSVIVALLVAWFDVFFPSFTILQIGAVALCLIGAFLYLQAFKALNLIEPIDEDEYTNGAAEKRDSRYILVFFGTTTFIGLIFSAPIIGSSYDAGRKYGRALAICHNQDMKLDKFDWDTRTGECEGLASVDENRSVPENVSGKEAE